MASQRLTEGLQSMRVPQSDCPVVAAGGDGVAVAAERDAVHCAGVSPELPCGDSGLGIEKMHGGVNPACYRDSLTVRTECHRRADRSLAGR